MRQNLPDRLNRRECEDFLATIKENVCSVFPFRSAQEQKDFTVALDHVLANEESFASADAFTNKVRGALASLKNSHTQLRAAVGAMADPRGFQEPMPDALIEVRMFENNVAYLKIDAWASVQNATGKDVGDLAEEALLASIGARAIIIDVRENGGGDSSVAEKVARHFVKSKTPFARILVRKDTNSLELESDEAYIEPKEPYIDTPLLLLTSPKCLSSNEMFILMLKDAHPEKTTIIGETTGGGSGNPTEFPIMLRGKKYELWVSTWSLVRMNGQELEGVGIQPDIPAELHTEGVSGGTDRVLQKALEYVSGN